MMESLNTPQRYTGRRTHHLAVTEIILSTPDWDKPSFNARVTDASPLRCGDLLINLRDKRRYTVYGVNEEANIIAAQVLPYRLTRWQRVKRWFLSLMCDPPEVRPAVGDVCRLLGNAMPA